MGRFAASCFKITSCNGCGAAEDRDLSPDAQEIDRRRLGRRRLKEQHGLAGAANPFGKLLKKEAPLQYQWDLRHMLAALRRPTEDLKQKMRSMKSRRRACSRISTAVVVGLLIVSLLLALLFAPAVTAAVAAAPAAAASIVQAVEPLFNSWWDEREEELGEAHEELLETLRLAESVARRLEGIRPLAEASAIAFDSIKRGVGDAALQHSSSSSPWNLFLLLVRRRACEQFD